MKLLLGLEVALEVLGIIYGMGLVAAFGGKETNFHLGPAGCEFVNSGSRIADPNSELFVIAALVTLVLLLIQSVLVIALVRATRK